MEFIHLTNVSPLPGLSPDSILYPALSSLLNFLVLVAVLYTDKYINYALEATRSSLSLQTSTEETHLPLDPDQIHT